VKIVMLNLTFERCQGGQKVVDMDALWVWVEACDGNISKKHQNKQFSVLSWRHLFLQKKTFF